MSGRCALRLRQRIHIARKRWVLSGRSLAGSGPLAARHRQVHAPCEAQTGNGHKRRSAKQAHRCGVLGHKGARRTRLDQRNTLGGRRGCEFPDWNDVSQSACRTWADNGQTGENRNGEVLPTIQEQLGLSSQWRFVGTYLGNREYFRVAPWLSWNQHHVPETLLGLMIEEVRSCARGNPWCSPALFLARDRVVCEPFQLPRSSLKKSQRKYVLDPRFAGQE